jgi:hypothetical protein
MKTIFIVAVVSVLMGAISVIPDSGHFEGSSRTFHPKVEALAVPEYKEAQTVSKVPITPKEWVKFAASKHGWSEGQEWQALNKLLGNESGLNPKAQNPTSTAYGMFQFLDSTWGSYGCIKTSDPQIQSECGMKYIKARYGSPSKALSFWYNQCGTSKGCWY